MEIGAKWLVAGGLEESSGFFELVVNGFFRVRRKIGEPSLNEELDWFAVTPYGGVPQAVTGGAADRVRGEVNDDILVAACYIRRYTNVKLVHTNEGGRQAREHHGCRLPTDGD